MPAAAAVWSVTTPEVAPASATEPADVPATPKDMAPLTKDALVSVVQVPLPLDVIILPAEPAVEQPELPETAAHAGLALDP